MNKFTKIVVGTMVVGGCMLSPFYAKQMRAQSPQESYFYKKDTTDEFAGARKLLAKNVENLRVVKKIITADTIVQLKQFGKINSKTKQKIEFIEKVQEIDSQLELQLKILEKEQVAIDSAKFGECMKREYQANSDKLWERQRCVELTYSKLLDFLQKIERSIVYSNEGKPIDIVILE